MIKHLTLLTALCALCACADSAHQATDEPHAKVLENPPTQDAPASSPDTTPQTGALSNTKDDTPADAPPPDPNSYDFVILTGDSNAVGDVDGRWQPSPGLSPKLNVPAYYDGAGTTPRKCKSDKLGGAMASSQRGNKTCLQVTSSRWGAELSLVDALQKEGWIPALIKVARGGLREDREYVPGAYRADLHKRLIDEVLPRAIQDLGQPRRVLWVHIGAHNISGATPGKFLDPMNKLYQDILSALNNRSKSLLVVVNLLHQDMSKASHSGYRPSFDTIVSEQKAFAQAHPRVVLHDPSKLTAPNKAEILQESAKNGIHYSGPGLEALGRSIVATAKTSPLWAELGKTPTHTRSKQQP